MENTLNNEVNPDTYLDDLVESMEVMSKVKADDVIEKLSQSSKVKKKGPSLELQYARMVETDVNFAIAKRGEDVIPYQWQGSYWKAISEHEGQQKAFKWLEYFSPENATARLATYCHRSSLFNANILASNGADNIVPMTDCYVIIADDGNLTVVPTDRSYGMTYQIGAKLNAPMGIYQPPSLPETSYFSQFLNTSLPDPKVRELVQQYCGYTLLRDTRFQVAQVWCGQGSNGKSVLLKIMQTLHQKTAAIRLDKMEQFGLASIMDASLAVSAETPKSGINEQVLKACITSDPVVLEYKGRNEFTYRPTAKWIVACNRFPRIQDETDGVFRRLQIIDWTVQFNGSRKIDRLDDLIVQDELEHVVNWCLDGLQRLLRNGGFIVPESVAANTQNQRESSNTVLMFSQDYFINYSKDGQTKAKNSIFKAYQDYCEEQGHMPCGTSEFWSRIYLVFPQLKEMKKRVNGKQMRHVNLIFDAAPTDVSN
ncbi:phage/plasmid primase, P4 family [Herbaspirillum sp. RV1423]|uniref:DNA primase family protein n=1 Tax=Herbaspirillum sp. RV1423 TaxID=1443993 RepID=UPI0004B6352A|nr:phage/plasmid primase, P4 family [Herbaspirillum sp. RV1423]